MSCVLVERLFFTTELIGTSPYIDLYSLHSLCLVGKAMSSSCAVVCDVVIFLLALSVVAHRGWWSPISCCDIEPTWLLSLRLVWLFSDDAGRGVFNACRARGCFSVGRRVYSSGHSVVSRC